MILRSTACALGAHTCVRPKAAGSGFLHHIAFESSNPKFGPTPQAHFIAFSP